MVLLDVVYFTTRALPRATPVRHECNTNDTSATQLRHEQHECDTIAKRMTQVRHECSTNNTTATRVENFDFNNDTSENIFSHSYISYIANERFQGEEQFQHQELPIGSALFP